MATLNDVEGGEDEYVMLDLDAVSGKIHIPPNAPYVLSGLDTLNPILIIDDKIKLIGEYEDTVGTCLVLSENDVVDEESGSSEANLKSVNKVPRMEVKPVCQLQKILRFKLLCEDAPTIDESSMKHN